MRKLLIVLALCGVSILNAQQLNVASYNVRNSNPNDAKAGNGWEQRCPVLTQLITFHDFDIFGAQEVKHNQLEDMLNALPAYNYIGVGRDDGKTKGEYAPIFYRKDKFKLLKSGNFWLSEDTTKPNKGWDAAYTRICTWGEFKDKTGKFKFWFFNLHMDHIGVVARRESAKLIIAKIKEMCAKDPVILTGDFNVDQTSESYQVLHESGILSDSYEVAQMRYATNGTCTGWNPNTYTPNRIDHIFVTPNFTVEKYGVLTDTYRTKNETTGKYESHIPSDHFPVKAVLKFQKKH